MRRKAKAKKRAQAQRQAVKEARRRAEAQAVEEARRRRARTAAARAAHSAHNHPAICAHDALVLPTILRLRSDGLSWPQIAQELEELFDPPGRRGRYRSGKWHATAVWRIARRHQAALHDAEIAVNGRRAAQKQNHQGEDRSR